MGERGSVTPPRSGYHEVRRGDSLYSIAWQYGQDWRELARRNGIRDPYIIRPGDRVYLAGATRATASSGTPSRPAGAPSTTTSSMNWTWPVQGEVIKGFAASGVGLNKGLDIRAPAGTPLQASAAGEVVYAGSGLRGFGQLVIVKHDEVWLSAYAHNAPNLVSEGQRVRSGERLAVLDGASERQRVVHFEIRRRGTPIDPAGVLPRR